MINCKRKIRYAAMNILVTNDDGIGSDGLWKLVRELKKTGRVTVVVPDREQSAIGTAVSLFRPLCIMEVTSQVDDVTAYTVDGTPADCVVLALGKLLADTIDLVVSGINLGSNVGEDVYISGTVGGALQGYFRGSSAMAVSAPGGSVSGRETAARTAALLAQRIAAMQPPTRVFLNVNAPDLPPGEVTRARITRLARTSHINTVEEDDGGEQDRYRLVRQQLGESALKGTDMYVIRHGGISITPLFTSLFDRPRQHFLDSLCGGLIEELHS